MSKSKPTHARHAKGSRIRPGLVVAVLLLAACVTVAAAAIAYGFAQNLGPQEVFEQATTFVKSTFVIQEETPKSSTPSSAAHSQSSTQVQDTSGPAQQGQSTSQQSSQGASSNEASSQKDISSAQSSQTAQLPTPVVAEYGGILIHSPIETRNVYGILFHQASYPWSLVMETKLPELDADVIFETHEIDIPANQPTGDEYMNAGALHAWRVGEMTEMDTSIDVGAAPGTTVYAPVSGTVVLAKTYELYDICTDYEVHIQPEGFPDLDLVVLHIDDVTVKAGDVVVAGQTPIAKVRDIAAQGIDGIHLAEFSDKENGNHVHLQLCDVNYEGYREQKLKGAIEVS